MGKILAPGVHAVHPIFRELYSESGGGDLEVGAKTTTANAQWACVCSQSRNATGSSARNHKRRSFFSLQFLPCKRQFWKSRSGNHNRSRVNSVLHTQQTGNARLLLTTHKRPSSTGAAETRQSLFCNLLGAATSVLTMSSVLQPRTQWAFCCDHKRN